MIFNNLGITTLSNRFPLPLNTRKSFWDKIHGGKHINQKSSCKCYFNRFYIRVIFFEGNVVYDFYDTWCKCTTQAMRPFIMSLIIIQPTAGCVVWNSLENPEVCGWICGPCWVELADHQLLDNIGVKIIMKCTTMLPPPRPVMLQCKIKVPIHPRRIFRSTHWISQGRKW